jgi:hypothetical protein
MSAPWQRWRWTELQRTKAVNSRAADFNEVRCLNQAFGKASPAHDPAKCERFADKIMREIK